MPPNSTLYMDRKALREKRIEHLESKHKIKVDEIDGCLLLDARSEGEFLDHHIPGAFNIPILDNEARAIVGTIYKQQNQAAAIDAGWDHLKDKIDELITSAEEKIDRRKIVVYCARGGMRSRILANLLSQRGHKIYQLEGGIKDYRNYLYKEFEDLVKTFKGRFIVLEGKTGTQKTKIIHKTTLPKIDLEDLAQHRSSIYGDLHLQPRSQKMFLFLLYEEFKKLHNEPYIIIEGESKRIGFIQIPEDFYKLIRKGLYIEVTADIDVRVKNVLDEYFPDNGKEVIAATPKLRKYLGKKVDWLIDLFQQGKHEEGIQYLLEEYYDKKYNMVGDYIHQISGNDVDKAVNELEDFIATR